MKRKLLPVIVLGLLLLSAAAALADGDIYVGGPWGTKITSLPYEIKTPGAYYLGGNLSKTGGGDGITITAGVNHVTLDLMGFTLNGSGSGSYGIYLNGSKNVEIRNGTVTGWSYGIYESGSGGMAHRIINVRAVGNNWGIYLEGLGHLIRHCEATASVEKSALFLSGKGIVSGCRMKFLQGQGLYTAGGIISDNVFACTGTTGQPMGMYVFGSGNLIMDNKISGCVTGINCSFSSGNSVIGNTVDAASGTTGISIYDDSYNVLDQNTVTGSSSAPYSPSSFSHVARRNNNPPI